MCCKVSRAQRDHPCSRTHICLAPLGFPATWQQVRSVLEAASAAGTASADELPSDADLDAAFTVADEDVSGSVDAAEFVRLMKLVKKGEVRECASARLRPADIDKTSSLF